MSDFDIRFYIDSVREYFSKSYYFADYHRKSNTYKDVYDSNSESIDDTSLIIHIVEGGEVNEYDLCVCLKIENVRSFISDLQNFGGSGGDKGYVFTNGASGMESSKHCAICEEEISSSPHVRFSKVYYNIWPVPEEGDSSDYTSVHKSCISEFVDKLEAFLSDEKVFRDAL